MTIENSDSNLFNALSDNTMLNNTNSKGISIYNLLASDAIYFHNASFVGHSYVNIDFGEEITVDVKKHHMLVGDNYVHFGIEKCYFTNYTTNSAISIYLNSIDVNGTNNGETNVYRGPTKLYNLLLTESNPNSQLNVIYMNLISNNCNGTQRFIMSNSMIKDNSHIKDLVSSYGDPLNNNYKYGISILFENNKFIDNKNYDSLIFAKRIDLATYIVYITAINNIFKPKHYI